MIIGNLRRGRNNFGAEVRSRAETISWRRRTWSDDCLELDAIARVVVNHVRRRRNDRSGKGESLAAGTQTLRGRRPDIRVDGEQIRNRIARRWKLEIGGIDHLRSQRAARNPNRLRAMMSFVSAAAAIGPGLSSAQIFCAGKLVSAVVDHVVTGEARGNIRA